MPSAERFVSLFSPGPTWVEGLSIEEQPGWDSQLAFFREQTEAGCLVRLGEIADREGHVVVYWEGLPQPAVERLAREAPQVVSGVLKVLSAPDVEES